MTNVIGGQIAKLTWMSLNIAGDVTDISEKLQLQSASTITWHAARPYTWAGPISFGARSVRFCQYSELLTSCRWRFPSYLGPTFRAGHGETGLTSQSCQMLAIISVEHDL